MALNASGENEHSGRIDDTPAGTEVTTESNHLAILDRDITLRNIRRGRDRSITNEDVGFGHALLQSAH
jgi:hypothetical protein